MGGGGKEGEKWKVKRSNFERKKSKKKRKWRERRMLALSLNSAPMNLMLPSDRL